METDIRVYCSHHSFPSTILRPHMTVPSRRCQPTPGASENDTLRMYAWSEARHFMALPQSLVMLTEEEFAARAAGVPAIAFEGGELPAFFGYDGVPMLAYRTMVRCGP